MIKRISTVFILLMLLTSVGTYSFMGYKINAMEESKSILKVDYNKESYSMESFAHLKSPSRDVSFLKAELERIEKEKEEEERKIKEEEERKEAERIAEEEEYKRKQEEAERVVREVEERRAKREADRIAKEEAEREAEIKAQKKAEEEKKAQEKAVSAAETKKVTNSNNNISNSDLEALAKMIYAEARGEPYQGKVAVGAVILNRVSSSSFPNTINGVLTQPKQFQPMVNGAYSNAKPSDAEYKAAKEALNGVDPTNGAVYFYAPSIATTSWHETLTHTTTIGSHKFFK